MASKNTSTTTATPTNRIAQPVHTIAAQQPTITKPGQKQQYLARAIAWVAVSKIAEKEIDASGLRDKLEAGASYATDVAVSATISGERFKETATTVLTVGHDSERAASQTPNPAGLIAYLLEKMNESTRAAVLRDLPGQFATAGDYPAVSKEVEKATGEMLKAIRAAKRGPVRGSVKCQYAFKS